MQNEQRGMKISGMPGNEKGQERNFSHIQSYSSIYTGKVMSWKCLKVQAEDKALKICCFVWSFL